MYILMGTQSSEILLMKDVEIASMHYSKQAQVYKGDENLTGRG